VKIHRIGRQTGAAPAPPKTTDALIFGPAAVQFWIAGGVFEVPEEDHAVAGLLRLSSVQVQKRDLRGPCGISGAVAAGVVLTGQGHEESDRTPTPRPSALQYVRLWLRGAATRLDARMGAAAIGRLRGADLPG